MIARAVSLPLILLSSIYRESYFASTKFICDFAQRETRILLTTTEMSGIDEYGGKACNEN